MELSDVRIQLDSTASNDVVQFWQGLENGNITFSDELDFDIPELELVFDEGVIGR